MQPLFPLWHDGRCLWVYARLGFLHYSNGGFLWQAPAGCGFLWIFTIFAANRTLFCLYLSYPITWAVTFACHLACFLIFCMLRKGVRPRRCSRSRPVCRRKRNRLPAGCGQKKSRSVLALKIKNRLIYIFVMN